MENGIQNVKHIHLVQTDIEHFMDNNLPKLTELYIEQTPLLVLNLSTSLPSLNLLSIKKTNLPDFGDQIFPYVEKV